MSTHQLICLFVWKTNKTNKSTRKFASRIHLRKDTQPEWSVIVIYALVWPWLQNYIICGIMVLEEAPQAGGCASILLISY